MDFLTFSCRWFAEIPPYPYSSKLREEKEIHEPVCETIEKSKKKVTEQTPFHICILTPSFPVSEQRWCKTTHFFKNNHL